MRSWRRSCAHGLVDVGLLTVVLLIGRGSTSAQGQRPPDAAALAQKVEIAPFGFSLRYPADWTCERDANVWRLVDVPPERARVLAGPALEQAAQVFITSETRRDHADALRRLTDVAAESTTPVTFLTINGWPAVQRRYIGSREQPGDVDIDDRAEKILRVVTAIAADRFLIRFDGRLPPTASPALEATVRSIGRSAIFRTPGDEAQGRREVERLRAAPRRTPAPAPRGQARTAAPRQLSGSRALAGAATPRAAPGTLPGTGRPGLLPSFPMGAAGLAQRVIAGGVASEAEIAVSTNGQDIVIAQQGQFTTSNDGGQTFPFSGSFAGSTGGDASLAFGRSATFYEGTIAGSSTGINVSTNNGQSFTFRANAFTCPATGPNQCGAAFPDQEHIAADRFNAAPGGDQVYSVWRHLNGNYGIVCSTDGGQNWSAAAFTSGDLPRITVGPDGSVYVVYQSGNNVMLNRYSSCAAGLAVQAGFPLTVATVGPSWVACPVPGLDRCNNGNNLSSFTVAVDDTNANHVYVAYAQNTSATNENIVVRDSTDGGSTWPATRVVTVNSGANARRFMPWLCTANGVAYASWFDRRASTAANNSLTDYFSGSASPNGAGTLVAGTEVQVNSVGSADGECNAGRATGSSASWPGASRAITDSTSCQPQPQLGGRCQNSPAKPTDSNAPCNLAGGAVCTGTETCQVVPLGGTPKYGDYNGNACAAGRFYAVWPSATPPPGTAATGNIDLYFAARVVAASQIQIPGPVVLPETCVGSSSLATANVCNGGKSDLHVDPITSSDPQFSVVTPSSGYPVTIGPSACFPFEVRFAPTSPGAKSATLTLPSDDTVNPSVSLLVSGTAGQASAAAIIADAGGFGSVCRASFRDLMLTIDNTGACPLTVTNVTSSSPDFQTPHVVSYPLSVAPGTSVALPVRFAPTSPGSKSGTISVATSDPAHPTLVMPVNGTGGQPTIATVVADTGNVGRVCRGAFRDTTVTIANSGTCPLTITNIASSSPEFQVPQVLSYPLVVAPGTSTGVPIRLQPTSPGPKGTTLTITSDDPATPSKTVALTGETPEDWVCHPPTFASISMTGGPTFGDTRTGDFTFSGEGRALVPFGRTHSFGVQVGGEFLGYHERSEGEWRAGLLKRWRWLQGGVFASVKALEVGPSNDAGALGQASFTLDVLLKKFRVSAFGSRGFHDDGAIARVVDQFGGGAQVGLAPFAPNTYLEGNLVFLHQPEPLGARPGAMLRVSHVLFPRLELTAEFTLNESLVGPTNNGRFVVGFVFGRWARPQDLSNRGTPLGTDVPRVRYVLVQ
jgi:hypothetical protein